MPRGGGIFLKSFLWGACAKKNPFYLHIPPKNSVLSIHKEGRPKKITLLLVYIKIKKLESAVAVITLQKLKIAIIL